MNAGMDFCLPTRDVARGLEICMLTEPSIERYWHSIEAMMRQVPKSLGDWTPESLYRRALSGGVQVWSVGDNQRILMVLLTQIAIFPQRRVLEIFWAAGQGLFVDAQELIDATMDLFAKKENCSRIDVIGRDGWDRVLKERGFKRSAIIWSRSVVHEGMQ